MPTSTGHRRRAGALGWVPSSRFPLDVGHVMPDEGRLVIHCRQMKGRGVVVVGGPRHARVAIAQELSPVHAQDSSRILQLGLPRIEYICPYGHGTLREDDLRISGMSMAEWEPHSDDMWAELYASSGSDADRQ